jgi:hypothetical protein
MRTFRKIAGFISINIFITVTLTIMFAQPSALKVLMKEAKGNEYDTLIMGESLGESAINPYVLSNLTGCTAYNLSRRIMPVVDFEYVLKEVNTGKHYNRVILELDYTYLTKNHTGYAGTDTNLLLRLTGVRRLEYIYKVLMNDNYNDSFSDFTVSIAYIKRIPKILKAKFNIDYIESKEESIPNTYSIIGIDNFVYIGRGFRYGVGKSDSEWELSYFEASEVKAENLKSFNRLVEYCNKNGIELICIQSALNSYRIKGENLGDVHEYLTDLCRKHNIEFYDLNYVKKEYFNPDDDKYVDLAGHMLGELADEQTEILAKILNANDKDIYFYDSYEEVLDNLN